MLRIEWVKIKKSRVVTQCSLCLIVLASGTPFLIARALSVGDALTERKGNVEVTSELHSSADDSVTFHLKGFSWDLRMWQLSNVCTTRYP